MATTSDKVEERAVTPAQQNKSTQPSVLLPTGAAPDSQKAVTAADGDFVTVGAVGNITVTYDSQLGTPGLTQAQQLLTRALSPYSDMEVIFGVAGGPVIVRISEMSAAHDGTGRGSHDTCDFDTGGTLFVDATFGNTTVNPLDLLVAIYVAELSESFMGQQGLGWGCKFSNGEGLSRFLAEQETSVATLAHFATVQTWHVAGSPNWIDSTDDTDREDVATGCAVAYL